MARICARCRQPLDPNEREHDCPADEPQGDGEDEAA